MDKQRSSDQHDKAQWEYSLIGLLMKHPSLWPHVRGILQISDFQDPETQALYQVLSAAPESIALPPELTETAEKASQMIKDAAIKDGDHAGLVKEAIQCVVRLRRTRLLQLNTDLTYKIDAAMESGDSAAVRALSQQLSTLQRELRTIYSATHLQR